MKKIITTILSLSLLTGNAAIPVFAENESAEGVTEQVEVMAEDTVIEPTPEIEVPTENTGIEPTPEIEVPAEEVLQAEQPHETDEPVFDVPFLGESVFPDAGKKTENDFELFSSDFSLMASSGSCGENVTYTLDDAGTLTISGTGAMNNYYSGSSPFSYNTNIKTVIIESGVTSIGGRAFEGCSGLTSITIPDSVTDIGGSAFRGCSGLTTVNFNATNCATMGSFDYYVFKDCNALTTVNIGNNVTNIPSYAFDGCSGLTSITIPESVTSIGVCAFYGCNGLKTVNYNAINCSSPSFFSYGAFYNLTSIETVNIGEKVECIPSYLFYNCSGLTNLTIPDSVTSIGVCAFFGCSGLTRIEVSDSNQYYCSIEGNLFNK